MAVRRAAAKALAQMPDAAVVRALEAAMDKDLLVAGDCGAGARHGGQGRRGGDRGAARENADRWRPRKRRPRPRPQAKSCRRTERPTPAGDRRSPLQEPGMATAMMILEALNRLGLYSPAVKTALEAARDSPDRRRARRGVQGARAGDRRRRRDGAFRLGGRRGRPGAQRPAGRGPVRRDRLALGGRAQGGAPGAVAGAEGPRCRRSRRGAERAARNRRRPAHRRRDHRLAERPEPGGRLRGGARGGAAARSGVRRRRARSAQPGRSGDDASGATKSSAALARPWPRPPPTSSRPAPPARWRISWRIPSPRSAPPPPAPWAN